MFSFAEDENDEDIDAAINNANKFFE